MFIAFFCCDDSQGNVGMRQQNKRGILFFSKYNRVGVPFAVSITQDV